MLDRPPTGSTFAGTYAVDSRRPLGQADHHRGDGGGRPVSNLGSATIPPRRVLRAPAAGSPRCRPDGRCDRPQGGPGRDLALVGDRLRLAGYHRRSSLSSEAAIKYYLVGALSNTAALLGAALLFGLAGSTTLAGIADGLAASGEASKPALVVGLVLLLGVVAFKVGSVPVHSWVPDVAQGAPAPVAGFITAIPKVGAFLFLARLVMALPDDLGWQPLIALAAAATMTLGNLASLWQDDVRRIFGWSAVSQTGYGLMAIVGLGVSPLALPALLYFLVAYVAGTSPPSA